MNILFGNNFSWLPRWLSGKESTYQCRRCGFNSCVGKILWKREWKPIPVFLPREFHGQRSLVGDSPWGCRRVRHDLATKQQKQQLEKGSNNLSASDISFH